MKKFIALILAGACGIASAQTPTANPMPDGSRDMYVGMGAISMPLYEGAVKRRVQALPALQMAWSNGFFISGMSAGMHLSTEPLMEFGPLISLQPKRSETGTRPLADGLPSGNMFYMIDPASGARILPAGATRLAGMDEIGARVQLGGFFNYYLSPGMRATSSLLAGAGDARRGVLLQLGLQQVAANIAPHHTLLAEAGLTLANRSYSQAFFGVSEAESRRSVNRSYAAAAGIKDVHASLRWNWALAPAWLLTSGVSVSRLAGSAADSPLVERPTNATLSSALAYRF